MVRQEAKAFTFARTWAVLWQLRRGDVLLKWPCVVTRLIRPRVRLLSRRRLQTSPVPLPVRQTEKGQALIEFAFIFPLLFLLILVIIDFGFALDRREVIQHGVREGARTAAVGADFLTIEDHTNNESGGVLDSVNVCYVDGNDGNIYPGNAGDSVKVVGNYKHTLMIGGGALFFGAIPPIDMTPTATARLEKTVLGATAC